MGGFLTSLAFVKIKLMVLLKILSAFLPAPPQHSWYLVKNTAGCFGGPLITGLTWSAVCLPPSHRGC